MHDAEHQSPLQSCHQLVERWVDDQFAHFIAELSQILLDKAMNDRARDVALVYFKHHKYLENNRKKIAEHFHRLLGKALRGEDPSVKVIPQQRPSAEMTALLDSVNHDNTLYGFCLVLREEVFTTLFQRAFNLLDPSPQVRETAREVFQREFNGQLGALHILLLEYGQTPQNPARVDRRINVLAWIDHLEQKLRNPAIDASTRALTNDRLEELRARLDSLDTLSQTARRLKERWYHPHDELEQQEFSDETLLAEVDKLFRPLGTMEGVPRSLKALASRIRPIMENVALTDRASFMQALHPAKQLLHQVTATVMNWLDSSAEERRLMLQNVGQSIDSGVTASADGYPGDTGLMKTLRQELIDYLAYQMHRVHREQQEEAGERDVQQSVSFMQDINTLLENKLEGIDVPPLVHKLVFGLWNRVIAEIWLEHGEEGIATQQALSLVDDILWYLECDDNTLHHTNTEFLGDQIERDLLNGLRLIDFNHAKGRELISSLKRLRKRLHSPPSPVVDGQAVNTKAR